MQRSSSASRRGASTVRMLRWDERRSLGGACRVSASVHRVAGAHLTSLRHRVRGTDVVNVLETLGVVVRRAKGAYAFCGWGTLSATLDRIAAGGSASAGDAAAGSGALEADASRVLQRAGAVVVPAAPAGVGAEDAAAFAAIQAAARAASAAAAAQPGGDSTLAGLTERFVRVFLEAPADTVQWEDCLSRLGATERSSRRCVHARRTALRV
jgi:hypothetical protein